MVREPMGEMKYNVLCDIDHVISDAAWRDGLLQSAEVDYDDYHYQSRYDKPHHEIVTLLRSLASTRLYYIVGLTARPEKWRKQTMDWMLKHEVPMDALLMRPDKSYDPSPKVKTDLVMDHYPNRFHRIAFVIDDRDDVVEAFRALNINTIQYFMKRSDNV